MALWGVTDADEAKPKWLTSDDKKEVFANTSGWVREAGSAWSGNDNADAQVEVLACIGNLTTGIGAADITGVEWITTAADKSDGFTLSVRVRYNEAVTVTGNPTLVVTNDTNANHTLVYASGSTSNELVFSLAISAGNAATDADDVLTVAAQSISLAGGTLKDTSDGTTVSSVVIAAAAVASTGSITVVA